MIKRDRYWLSSLCLGAVGLFIILTIGRCSRTEQETHSKCMECGEQATHAMQYPDEDETRFYCDTHAPVIGE